MGQANSPPKPPTVRNNGKLALDPPTETLPAEVDLPPAVAAETARLSFHVSPLSSKGLLLQQTRDALKALMEASRGGRIVKLRAFVAGTGDARRVRQIVSEAFAEKKQPLPALTTVQAGELPKDGAQIVMESVSEALSSRAVNPGGLAFFPARLAPDAAGAIRELSAAAREAGVEPADVLRVTCFVGSGGAGGEESRAAVARAFPTAAKDGAVAMIQPLRAASGSSAGCEGVGRLKINAGPARVSADLAVVTAPKLIFSGAQMAFGDTESDLRLAMERLQKALEPLGVTYQDVVFAGFYPVGRAAEQHLPALSAEFFHKAAPGTTLIFEGLPSPDASVSIEVIAGRPAQ
jgi:enamine deaminase RidA (YjgF/YER057c/UK114 family)